MSAMGRALDAARSPLTWALLIVVACCAVAVTLAAAALYHGQGEGGMPLLLESVGRFAEVVLCAAPIGLMIWLTLIAWNHDDRLSHTLSVRGGPVPTPLLASWKIEAERAKKARSEVGTHAMLFGLLTSLALACASVLTLSSYLALLRAPEAAQGGDSPHLSRFLVGVMILSAVATSFITSFGQIAPRASRQDVGARLLGQASRSLLMVLLTAVALGSALVRNETIRQPFEAIVGGTAVGVLGARIFETVQEAIGIVFGVSSGNDDDLEEFASIDGLNESERLRLAELGITSLQGLAFASPAMLFVATRYPWERICDWQDQALLFVVFGSDRAERWRVHLGVRGASQARQHAEQALAADSGLLLLAAELRYADDQTLRMALQGLRDNADVARLELWKGCAPVEPAKADDGKP
jgi:hypothetical protein